MEPFFVAVFFGIIVTVGLLHRGERRNRDDFVVPSPKSLVADHPFRYGIRLNDSGEWDSSFIKLTQSEWNELNPQADRIAEREQSRKDEIARVREEKRAIKSALKSLAGKSQSVPNPDSLRRDYEEQLSRLRASEKRLALETKEITQQWREYREDKARRRANALLRIRADAQHRLKVENRWFFFLIPGERVRAIVDIPVSDGEDTYVIKSGARGVVCNVERLWEDRYTFSVWFHAGHDTKDEILEYDPAIHGQVLETRPRAKAFSNILDLGDEAGFAERRKDPWAQFLMSRRIQIDPQIAVLVARLERDSKRAKEHAEEES